MNPVDGATGNASGNPGEKGREGSPVTVALLGASNLSRSYRALNHSLRENLRPCRVRVLGALGPGRGYAAPGGLWPLKYPPIQNSSIFAELKKSHLQSERTLAFLTDLGNDFLYNVTGEELIDVLENLIAKLEESGTNILVTPIHPVLTEILTPTIYKIIRTLLYYKSQVSYEQVITGIKEVNHFLNEMENSGRISLVHGLDKYLGWDYVHYGWVSATSAWSEATESILSCIGQPLRRPIHLDRMLGSYLENGVRLVGTEVLGLFPRRQGFY